MSTRSELRASTRGTLLAWVGASSIQQGPLWWASWHRHPHKHSAGPGDVHSPVRRGFWFSRIGWYFGAASELPDLSNVKDLTRHPELRFVDRHWWLPPATLALGCFALGAFRRSSGAFR